jgi:Flp pilus assembly protein TadD
MQKAEAHRAAGEYGAAEATYQIAARLNPRAPLPWIRRGEVYLLQNRPSLAIAVFMEAERLGASGEALVHLAEAYAARGDWGMAIRTWLRALPSAPDPAEVYVDLGRAFVAQGQFDLARSYLRQALKLQPTGGEVADAQALLGRLVIDQDPEQAANYFRQAGDDDMLTVLETIAAESQPARQALLLGTASLQRNELPLARYHLERAVSLAPNDAAAKGYLAHTLDRIGETAAAQDLLEQALELDGASALTLYFLGAHHRRVGNLEAAQAALWEAFQLDPENAAIRAEMAGTFVDQANYASAEEWYVGAADVAEGKAEFQLMLVHFYVDHLYRIEESGLAAAEALVEEAPGDARAHDLLGWARHLSGLQAEAEQALKQALRLDPGLVSAQFHLGSLYATMGQEDLARSHLQKAVDLDTTGYYRQRAELVLRDL